MTQNDYELIAGVFAHHRKTYENRTDSVTVELIEDMAVALSKENPCFDSEKFTKACGGEE